MKTNIPHSLFATPLRLAVVCLLTLTVCAPVLRAADANPPDKMSYQSYLVDANGNPLGSTNTGPKNYDAIFRIWNDQMATAPANRLWTEQQTITVDKGYFSILLGEGNAYGSEARPALSSLFGSAADTSDRYVEMTVKGIGPGGADSTILPRVRLLPAPYAFLAKNAMSANSLSSPTANQIVTVSGGWVGINNPSPTTTLDVNGTIKAGAGFVGNGTIPLGGIIMWSGTTVPAGWALCDGQGGRPDLRGRFILGSGAGPGLTARSMGQTGGEEGVVLRGGDLPNHNHKLPNLDHGHGVNDPGHNHSIGSDDGGWNYGNVQATDRRNRDTWTSSSRTGIWLNNNLGGEKWTEGNGSNWAHNNLPPFYVLAFIMRVN